MKIVLSSKNTHDEKCQALAVVMCYLVGIEPEDSMDGSSNWFMFYNEAEKIVTDLEKRFPVPQERK